MEYIVIDIETLSTRAYPIVPAIAAVHYRLDGTSKPDIQTSFMANISIKDQKQNGLVTDGATLKFWDEQDANLRQIIMSGIVLTQDALEGLTNYIETIRSNSSQVTFVAKPARFDQAHLEELYESFGMKAPWDHWEWLCLRSLMTHYGVRNDDVEFEGTKHDPLCDAIHEAHLHAIIPAGK